MLHLSQVNGSSAPLLVKRNAEWGEEIRVIVSLIGAYELIWFRRVIDAIIRLQRVVL